MGTDIATREEQLADHATAIRKIGRRAMIEIGHHLTQAKDLCKHGDWLPWLEREFSWDERTARNYKRVHEAFKSEIISDLDIPDTGLYLLAASSTPEEVREDVIRRAKEGEKITTAKVKAAIKRSKPLPPDEEIFAAVNANLQACYEARREAIADALRMADEIKTLIEASPAARDVLVASEFLSGKMLDAALKYRAFADAPDLQHDFEAMKDGTFNVLLAQEIVSGLLRRVRVAAAET